jgi:indole-3-glycerol phosphate synthase
MNILEEIVQHKKMEVTSSKLIIPICELEQMKYFTRQTLKLTDYLRSSEKTGIITEFKRKSPSKGMINKTSSVEEVTQGYTSAGASALSILTDFNFFGGSVDDLMKARKVNNIPILRKDFIIDEYQVIEAKSLGADAILLIAAILNKKQARELASKAKEMGLQILLELHEESELDIANEFIDLIGINNRNLKTFMVDPEHSVKLAEKIPDEFLKISESGIESPDDIIFMMQHGFEGFLIGETFMKNENPGKAFADFVDLLNTKRIR